MFDYNEVMVKRECTTNLMVKEEGPKCGFGRGAANRTTNGNAELDILDVRQFTRNPRAIRLHD